MPTILPTAFFDRPTVAVAENLLGKVLVYQSGHTVQRAIITEVEAYDGPKDRACHAHRGRTERNEPMFGPAGHWYIYFVYGMHWMLNIVSGKEGYPAAILIRGVCPCQHDTALDGPGKITRALGIDGSFNAKKSARGTGLWIEDAHGPIPQNAVQRTPRIGVDSAGEWAAKPYRFVLRSTPKCIQGVAYRE